MAGIGQNEDVLRVCGNEYMQRDDWGIINWFTLLSAVSVYSYMQVYLS